jgi:hypothetical protein
MKKTIFLLMLICYYCMSAAQNTFPVSGNVGIGTTSPNTRLQIVGGNIRLSNPMGYPSGINIDFNFPGGWAREYSFSYKGEGKLFSFGAYGTDSTLRYGYIGGNSTSTEVFSTPWMVFLPSGNVGIGTTSPQSKLAVNGTITAQRVIITQTGWPDFVFDSAYQLPYLSEVNSFIKTNHHLPGIPSENEVAEKGLDIADMQQRQMEKLEELTLYLIRQDSIIREQQKAIESLKMHIARLEDIISK